jgi:shikimate dehydrogenase
MTVTIALLGHPVAHSVSPALQQAALDAVGFEARYEAWDVPTLADLRPAVERLRSGSVLGANVTIPYKEAVSSLIDRPDPLVERTGVANTIVRRNGMLEATNTDVAGILRALDTANVEVAGKPVVLLGAGGSARAVVMAMGQLHVSQLTIANRTIARAMVLTELSLNSVPTSVIPLEADSPALRVAVHDAALVINATSLGMLGGPDEGASPLPQDAFAPGQAAFDLVYVPERTPFLAAAEAGGAQAIGGLAMLVHQGAESFRLWTGLDAPLNVMFAAAREALRARARG